MTRLPGSTPTTPVCAPRSGPWSIPRRPTGSKPPPPRLGNRGHPGAGRDPLFSRNCLGQIGAGFRRDDEMWEAPNEFLNSETPMPNTQLFAAGGYRYMPHAFQYSGGVIAEPGFAVERVRFRRLLPLAQG